MNNKSPFTSANFFYPTGTIIAENSTHVAVIHNDVIKVYTVGLQIEDLILKPDYLYCMPLENEDDLFDIFERYDEGNRINVAEANREFANY